MLAVIVLGVYFLTRPSKKNRVPIEPGQVAKNGAPAPQPPPAPPPPPPPPPFHAKPDPAPEPAPRVVIPESLQVALVGPHPLFASGDGPYYLDTTDANDSKSSVNPRIPVKSAPGRERSLSVIDLRTGKPAGTLPHVNVAGARVEPRLSPDGQHLMCVGASPGGPTRGTPRGSPRGSPAGSSPAVEVWKQGAKEPVCRLQTSSGPVWMDFTSAEEAITLCDAGTQYQVQLWKIPDGKVTKSFNLPHPLRRSTRSGPALPATVALSPGRRYLAVAIPETSDQPGQLVLMALADGKVVGSLGGGQGVCRGLSFSPDGAELRAVYSHQPRGQQREARLLAWSMKDGKSSGDADLANVYAGGPPLPGPDRDTVLLRGQLVEGQEVPLGEVIDRPSGITVYQLPFTPVRWLGEKGLLGYQPAINRHTGSTVPAYVFQKREVRNVAFDRDDYRGKARVARAAVAPRPEASPGDRTAVRSLQPEPGPWAVPADPGKALAVKSGALRLELGEALFAGPPGKHAAVLFLRNHAQPRPRQALLWSRYDLESGRRIDEPHTLWPWIRKGTDQGTHRPVPGASDPQQAPLLGSLQGDGSHLAVRDTANPDRVDVWAADGKRVVGLVPYGKGTEVEWLGWAGARLLTLGAGKLTAWEVPAGRAVYEVEGGYKGLAALSPGRAWVAVSAAEHLDVLDAATGACLGRLPGGDVSGGSWTGLSVSFDGRGLAGVRSRPAPNDWRTIHTWDLQSGQARASFPIALGSGDAVHWCGSDHLLLGRKELVSLPLQTTLLTFNTLLSPTPGTLDGRLWCVATEAVGIGARGSKEAPTTGSLVACTVPGPGATPELPGPAPAPWEVVYRAGMTVKVEVDLGDKDRNEAAAELLAGKLWQAGFTVGEGDWKVVLNVAQQDSQTKLTGMLGAEVAVPEVRGELRLIAPDGAVAASVPQGLHFYAFKTKYRQFQEVGVRGTTTHYDFGGRNPHSAMAEEVWGHFMKGLPRLKWPHGLVKHQGKYEPLPLTRPLEPDAGP